MKKYLYILFLLVLINSNLSSTTYIIKEPNFDSLISEIPKLKLDTNKINYLLEITDKYNRYSTDTIDIFKYAEEALKLSKQINWKEGQVRSLFQLGILYDRRVDYYKAIEYYQNTLKISKEIGNKYHEFGALLFIGNTYESLSNYPKAIEYFELGLEKVENFSKNTDVNRALFLVLRDLFSSYEKYGDYKKASEYYKRYVRLNDSIQKSKYEKIIDSLENKLYNDYYEMDIAIINKDKKIEKLMNYIIYGGVSGLILIIALVLILLFKLKRIPK